MRYALFSGLDEKKQNKLREYGICPVETPENMSLGEYTRNHADLSFFYAGKNVIFLYPSMKSFAEKLEKYGFDVRFVSDKQGDKYPFDVPLNISRSGKKAIANIDTASKDVLKYLTENDFEIISVRQGYTSCSCVFADDNHLITDDESIYRKSSGKIKNVLLLKKGKVKLPGFEYGFIGGASGVISGEYVFFNGSDYVYPDIREFLSDTEIKIVDLADGELFDIGSIIITDDISR